MDGASIVQKELNETIVRSREEIEERLETEDRQQLGDISDEVYPRDTSTSKFHLRVPWICTRTVCVCVYARALSCRRPPPPPSSLAPRKGRLKGFSRVPKVHPTLLSSPLSFSLCFSLSLSLSLLESCASFPFPRPGRKNFVLLSAKADSRRPLFTVRGVGKKIYERPRFLSKCVARRGFLSRSGEMCLRKHVGQYNWEILRVARLEKNGTNCHLQCYL